MKRMLDLFGALFSLTIFSPIMLVMAIMVYFKLGTPVIFRQVRPGLHGRPFTIYKFRTMIQLTDKKGDLLPDDLRLTPFGSLLRQMSLDELPQLLNVLKGDLSLVGPRPLLMEYLSLYSKEQARRHDVRPGITGWAQINGRNTISWEEKFKLDIWYVDNQCFWLDMKIIWLTLIKAFKKEGICERGHATVQKFRG